MPMGVFSSRKIERLTLGPNEQRFSPKISRSLAVPKCLNIHKRVFPMKLHRLLSMLLLVTAASPAGQSAAPRLIVRGDDMGSSHSANEAIIQCYKEGIMTSV